jgi:hypothetical protein
MVRYGIIAAGVFSPATPIITASFTNLAPSTSTPKLPAPTEVVLVTDTLSVIPTEFPLPSPIGVYFGEWIITIGKFPSIESAKSYIVPFVDNGYSVQIFCRISEADPSQTPEIRAAVIGFDSENSMNEALPRVQVLNQYAQSKQFPLWCLNPVQQVDYVSCNFVSCQ